MTPSRRCLVAVFLPIVVILAYQLSVHTLSFPSRSKSRLEARWTPNARIQQTAKIMENSSLSLLDVVKYSPLSLLDVVRTFGMVDLPSRKVLGEMSKTQLTMMYHSYIDNINILCHRKLRMGRVGDGGWEICDDEAYRPSEQCLVYSFGINHDFTFDTDIAKWYGCQVYSFDPSMKGKIQLNSPNVHFSRIGIADEDTFNTKLGWRMMTLGSIKNKFQHTNRIMDILKMDVETAEWKSIMEMIKSHDLTRVRQLLLEFHLNGEFKTKLHGLTVMGMLADLHDIGFRKFYVHKNPVRNLKKNTFSIVRTPCYEVHYVNINFRDGR